MIALGLELRDREHSVIFATTEEYRETVEALGLDFHAIRPDTPTEPEILERIMDPASGPETILKEVLFAQIREMYDDLMAIAKEVDFLVAHEIIYAAPLGVEVGSARLDCAVHAGSARQCRESPAVRSLQNAPAQAIFGIVGAQRTD